jgi:hypothetical protein
MKLRCLSISFLFLTFVFAQKTPLPNQKTAILIVGNDAQSHAVGHLNSLATIFQKNGIFVYKFYYPNARWSDIQAKANTCSFFVYTGHGFGNGGLDGEFGGLYVHEFVMAQDIVDGIDFQYKPLIIYLNACGSHGTSAGDPADIGIAEASKRVSDTALPFFMVGAGGYFATSGLITGFLEDFLKGTSLNSCFKNYAEPWQDILKYKAIASSNALNTKYMGISGYSTDENSKARSYDTAFVGPLNYTLQSINQTSK